MIRRKTIDVYKIVDEHPVTGHPIDLKWFRGASRYNNDATLYGNKYLLRYIIAYAKTNPYIEQELKDYLKRQAADNGE